jgi:hypothetical protein
MDVGRRVWGIVALVLYHHPLVIGSQVMRLLVNPTI